MDCLDPLKRIGGIEDEAASRQNPIDRGEIAQETMIEQPLP